MATDDRAGDVGGLRTRLEQIFPNLRHEPYEIIAAATDPSYNCVAWAAGDATRPWWPVQDSPYFWPVEPRLSTLDGFVAMFETLRYRRCASAEYEPGFEKVAIYGIETDDPD